MKKRILALSLALALGIPITQAAAYGSEEEKTDVFLDAAGLQNADEIYEAYAEIFNGANIRLTIDDTGFDYLPTLRRFDFESLELIINLTGHYLYFQKELMFPNNTDSVEILYRGVESLTLSDELDNFVTSLWADCPEAVINGDPVEEVYAWLRRKDTLGMFDVYLANAKLNYVFELAEQGLLETAGDTPVYSGKLIFKIIDGTGITSSEAIEYGESFYDIDSSMIAYDFDEADTAVFVYPVRSFMGTYANGGEAKATYTKVCVVDLNTMKMYEPFTVAANNPPQTLEIEVVDGEYSTEGVEGEYEPDLAMEYIVQALSEGYVKINKNKEDESIKAELLPWYKPGAEEGEEEAEADNTALVLKAAAAALANARAETAAAKENESEIKTEESSAAAIEPTDSVEEETTASDENETAADEKESTEEETTVSDENETNAEEVESTVEETTTAAAVYVKPETAGEAASSPYGWLSDELLEKIFEALGDDVYRNTYNLIKNGKDIAYGSTGEAALGIQKTVIAFGKSVAADSSIGNRTLNALNSIQTALGQTYTGKISSQAYAQLMPALLIHINEAAAEKLLRDLLTYSDGNMYDYLKAGTCYAVESYYQAKSYYESSKYSNYLDMAEFCTADMPGEGEIYKDADAGNSDAGVTIVVNNDDENAATCVELFDTEGKLVLALLVKGSGTVTASIPAGNYSITDGIGYRWYGTTDMFGPDGKYETMIFDDGSETMEMRSGYDYTIKFNSDEHSNNGYNIGSAESSWYDLIG